MIKALLLCTLLICHLATYAQKPIPDKTAICDQLKEMLQDDKLYRTGPILVSLMASEQKYSEKEIDSVWALQIKLDNKNTEKLIAMVKDYGWLSDERIACEKINSWIIFRHAQEKYFEEIAVLIEKEHKAERLSDWHYKLITNHLKGRPRE